MPSTDAREGRNWPWVILFVTICYFFIIYLFRGVDIWALFQEGELNELGDFLAGIFTPLVFLWLIVGYLMQYKELVLQRQESRRTQSTLSEQVSLLQQQVKGEYQRSLPRLKLEMAAVTGGEQVWKIRNYGAKATELTALIDGVEQALTLQGSILLSDAEVWAFAISYPGDARSFRCEARFVSDLGEKLRQIWEIRRTGEKWPTKERPTFEPVKELTKGPEPY